MPNLNKVTLMGHLGKDPEVKSLNNGTTVATFSIAITERYKDNKTTTWLDIVFYGKTAETIGKYLHKGDPIYIEGKINNRSWEDNNGQKHYKTEIIGNSFIFLASNKNKSTYVPGDAGSDVPF